MLLLNVQNEIAELLGKFVAQVEAHTAFGLTDINKLSEVVLIPLLREIYGYTNLRNLNTTESNNFPGIDLADDTVGVAFQITSTPDNEKIKKTLRTFIEHKLDEKYNRLIVYILTRKQRSYTETSYSAILQEKITFLPQRDIWDSRTLIDTIKDFQVEKAQRVLNILRDNFGPPDPTMLRRLLSKPRLPQATPTGFSLPQETETLHLNLLPVFFPKTLYIADIAEDITTEVVEPLPSQASLGTAFGKKAKPTKHRLSARLAVLNALHGLGISFSSDWNCFERKIITFHDLTNPSVPLREAIDLGTITPISTEEFCKINKDHENVIKHLLRRSLQQTLYHRRVAWQKDEKLFIFMETANEIPGITMRLETWFGKRDSSRRVFERKMKTEKPEEILHCKHLAFGVQFYNFADKWYLGIKPDWFFSSDGYNPSHYGADRIKYLKRQENNGQIYNQVRFLVYFLTNTDIFTDTSVFGNSFLNFGQLESFSGSPKLMDNLWLPPKSEKDAKPKDSNKTTEKGLSASPEESLQAENLVQSRLFDI